MVIIETHTKIVKFGRLSKSAVICVTAEIVIYKALCFDVAQGQMNAVHNEWLLR